VFSVRGPWSPTWQEYIPASDEELNLSSGRVVEQSVLD
jgi:hypothetical protein